MSKFTYPLARPEVGEEVLDEIRKVILSGWLTQGPYVERFEKEVAKYVGAKYGIAVSSCTSALYLCLKVLKIRPGDEVIVPDFTFPATGNVVLEIGARPVLVDVREDSLSIDPVKVREKLSERTKAIIVVHPFGFPADMDPLMEIAEANGLYVIEDAATALGSIYKGKYAGTIGDFGCFSFHPRKIVATGEGGMIVSNHEEYYEELVMYRSHGLDKSGIFKTHSLNFRMSDIQAAMGLVQLKKIEQVIERRRELAEVYRKLIKDLLPLAKTFREGPSCRSTYQSFIIKLPDHAELYQGDIIYQMRKRGIEVQIGTYALHMEPSFHPFAKGCDLSISKKLRRTTLTLPFYSTLNYNDLKCIAENLAEVYYMFLKGV